MGSRFAHRSTETEIMDDLAISGEVIDKTLRELEIINRLLGGNSISVGGVATLLKGRINRETISIADLGCGGGDILKLMAQWGRNNKIKLRLTGIDANPHIIAYARDNAMHYPEIDFQCVNIFSEEFCRQQYDIIVATLFTHHFTDAQLTTLLKSWQRQALIGIVINDLHRHWFAYHSIKWLTRLFSKSFMVKNDAAVSVARSFLKRDWQNILKNAGISAYRMQWRWAFRWKIVIFTGGER